jgi:hypothetical protein
LEKFGFRGIFPRKIRWDWDLGKIPLIGWDAIRMVFEATIVSNGYFNLKTIYT